MNYQAAIKYLESFINYERTLEYPYKDSLKLERIKEFLVTIGNPQDSLRCIHVAGTKGKGSTCAFIAYILREAGDKTGLYTSPHLSDFRERIRILNQKPRTKNQKPKIFEGMITKQYLTSIVSRLKPTIDKYNRSSKYGALSFFEVYTALAFVYFKEKKVDFAVLETGLGGRLDATNTVHSLVSVITPISYEHTDKLGGTLKDIATEKSGIIKNQRSEIKNQKLIVISAPQDKEARLVIRNKCKQVKAKLYEVGRDITYKKVKYGAEIKGFIGEYKGLKIPLTGEHQLINAAAAIGVVEALGGIKINSSVIRQGIKDTLWPGRCEIVSRNPLVILDGAQNLASAKALVSTVRNNFRYKKLFLVLGISKDKDIRGVCRELSCAADEVILTKADNQRASDPAILKSFFVDKKPYLTCSVKEALASVKLKVGRQDLVLITGSLFVVGEARNYLVSDTRLA